MKLAQQPRMVGIWRNLTALLLVLGILGGGAEVEARKHHSRHVVHAAKTQRPPDFSWGKQDLAYNSGGENQSTYVNKYN